MPNWFRVRSPADRLDRRPRFELRTVPDYAMLKIYGVPNDGEKRCSPAVCLGCETHKITGNPDPKHIITSYIERQNLTVSMSNRRFTRLANAFSKKIGNHVAMLALRSGPTVAITNAAVSSTVAAYLRKAGVQVRRPGAPTLRRACVQKLIEAEFP